MIRGQTFSTDLLLGIFIITAAIISVVLFLPGNEAPFTQDAERLNVLMTEGVPENWNASTVIIPGFLTDRRFDQAKIDAFANMTPNDQQSLLGIASSFTIRFSSNGTALNLCTACGQAPANYTDRITIQRYGLLGSNIAVMEVQLYK